MSDPTERFILWKEFCDECENLIEGTQINGKQQVKGHPNGEEEHKKIINEIL